jgi:biopolymer transport protein ExbB
MRFTKILSMATLLAVSALAQQPGSFDRASAEILEKLQRSQQELSDLLTTVENERLPLARELEQLESELAAARDKYQDVSRTLTSRTLDLTNLKAEIEDRRREVVYIGSLFTQYLGELESRLHTAELPRYRDAMETARLAPEDEAKTRQERYESQMALLDLSFARLDEALGGSVFAGRAVDPAGVVHQGRFALLGPVALFRSADGTVTGTVESRLGSQEPRVVLFGKQKDDKLAQAFFEGFDSAMPFDPTLGKAHEFDATEITFLQEVERGGPVMYPIFVLAGTALLVGVYKWIALALVRRPSRRRLQALLMAVREHDEMRAGQIAGAMPGPVGRMLQAGVQHVREPRDLLEEVMFEVVLKAKQGLQRMLPFIAVCAAAAPLMGLLGTVTGIINTFKMIVVVGSDVNSLSGGISEALITTKYGLIVAIPSLLLHAWLSRKARGIVGELGAAAVTFANEVSRSQWAIPANAPAGSSVDPKVVENQVRSIMRDILGPEPQGATQGS